MKVTEAVGIAGRLSEPSKMPGYSYGLPAEECVTGRKLVNVAGSVCEGCYALKGFYALYARTIKPSQYKRLESISNPQWVEAMVVLIGRANSEWFRWHDSGDLQSVEHLRKIAEIAERLPKVRFWLPTREYRIVQDYMAQYGGLPVNLVVRLSAHIVDGPHPQLGGLPTSGVHIESAPVGCYECPARSQGNKCGDCRACWDKGVKAVSYHKH